MTHDLSSLQKGGGAKIDTLTTKGPLRRRLFDLGFTPGAHVRCLFAAPGGDPRAYLIRDTVIALRNADARTIWMENGIAESSPAAAAAPADTRKRAVAYGGFPSAPLTPQKARYAALRRA